MSLPQINTKDYIQTHWTTEEKKHVTIVVDFIQNLMNKHDTSYILEKYAGNSYTQHNRAIPNEIEGVVAYIKTMIKRYPEYSYAVKNIFVDGDYVILHSHVTMKAKHRGNEKKGFIITDTFKLNEGKLAAHWDAVQPIDTFSRLLFFMIGGKIANNNSTF